MPEDSLFIGFGGFKPIESIDSWRVDDHALEATKIVDPDNPGNPGRDYKGEDSPLFRDNSTGEWDHLLALFADTRGGGPSRS